MSEALGGHMVASKALKEYYGLPPDQQSSALDSMEINGILSTEDIAALRRSQELTGLMIAVPQIVAIIH